MVRTIALVAAGVVGSLVLLVVLFQIDIGPEPVAGEPKPADEDIIELIPRSPPEGGRAVGLDGDRMTMLPDLDEGAWIETFDTGSGRLAQRYRFERLDPDPPGKPPGWALIARPQAEIYGDSGSVVIITADSALVHRPRGQLRSGSMIGNVMIRYFEIPGDRPLDLARDAPAMVITTAQADFDNFLGEIRCDGSFRAETSNAEFLGERLAVLINDRDQRINELSVRQVDFVRLARGAASADTGEAETSPATAEPDAAPADGETAAPEPSAEPPVFYELVLHENVRVEDRLRTLTGDRLSLVFSAESDALAGSLARASRRFPVSEPFVASSLRRFVAHSTIVLVAIAAADEQPPRPTPPSLAPPRSPDDVYITCSGGLIMVPLGADHPRPDSPRDAHMTLSGRPARLHDAERSLDADCSAMVYEALTRMVRLVGTDTYPLEITSPDFSADGQVFYYGDVAAEGGFSGPGDLSIHRETGDVLVRWRDGVDLEFCESDGDGPGPLDRARFRGGAVATSPDGELAGDTIDLAFETGPAGETVARRMLATGEARATDTERTIWADRLDATFVEAPAGEAGAETSAALAGAAIDRFDAAGDVQIALVPGGRVFADRVVGESGGERVVLTGEKLTVAQGAWLLDGGGRIELDDAGRIMDWPGPGRARMYGAPILAAEAAAARVTVPDPSDDPQMTASWHDALSFDAGARDGAGDVTLNGKVHVVSHPNPHEVATLDGERVTLELARDAGAGPADPADIAEPAEGPLGGARNLERLVAAGDARLESRVQEPGEATPRIFYVAGERLWYREATGEGEVAGPGNVLVRDERPVPEAGTDAPEAGGAPPILRRGTTSFTFAERVTMTRRDDGLTQVEMIGPIEMRHLDLEGQSSTLACQSLAAVMDRAPEIAPAGESVEPDQAELRELTARGNVFLRTPERDVACEIFDYDVTTGIAELHGSPERQVIVYQRLGLEPLRFDHARWDMQKGTIRVARPTGGGG